MKVKFILLWLATCFVFSLPTRVLGGYGLKFNEETEAFLRKNVELLGEKHPSLVSMIETMYIEKWRRTPKDANLLNEIMFVLRNFAEDITEADYFEMSRYLLFLEEENIPVDRKSRAVVVKVLEEMVKHFLDIPDEGFEWLEKRKDLPKGGFLSEECLHGRDTCGAMDGCIIL
jgi:hypothetical protein